MTKTTVYLSGAVLIVIILVVVGLLMKDNVITLPSINYGSGSASPNTYSASYAPIQTATAQVPTAITNRPGATVPTATDISNNNFLVWANGIIQKFKDTGNLSLAQPLNKMLIRVVAGTPTFYQPYILDKSPYYVKAVPSVSFSDTNQYTGANTVLDAYGLYKLCYNLMGLIAKNYVQANTSGQAIGSRQSVINSKVTDIDNNVGSNDINNVPTFTPPLIAVYNYAQTTVWPLSSGGGGGVNSSDLNTIIKDVISLIPVALTLIA